MFLHVRTAFLAIIAVAGALSGQVVSFNSPTEWMTLRDQSVTAKVLLDTAKIEQKRISLKLEKVTNRGVRRLASKTFRIQDYAEDFPLGSMNAEIAGGKEYLRISWTLPGADETGALSPFGVVALDSAAELEPTVRAVRGKPEDLSKDGFIGIGEHAIAAVYDEDALTLAIRKDQSEKTLTFAFDGKNGKYAFVSYPDRFVAYTPGADSAETFYYRRSVSDTGIVYKRTEWIAGVESHSTGAHHTIRIPWHDMGLLPFDGRIIGFAAFTKDETSAPEGAKRWIPGTWGNLYLGQKSAESQDQANANQ